MSKQVFQKVSLEDQEKAISANGGKLTMEMLAEWEVHAPVQGSWQAALVAGTDPSIRPRARRPKPAQAPEPQRKSDGTLWITLEDKKMIAVVGRLLIQYVSPEEMAILVDLMSKEVYKSKDVGLHSFLELISSFPRVQRYGLLKFMQDFTRDLIEYNADRDRLNAQP